MKIFNFGNHCLRNIALTPYNVFLFDGGIVPEDIAEETLSFLNTNSLTSFRTNAVSVDSTASTAKLGHDLSDAVWLNLDGSAEEPGGNFLVHTPVGYNFLPRNRTGNFDTHNDFAGLVASRPSNILPSYPEDITLTNLDTCRGYSGHIRNAAQRFFVSNRNTYGNRSARTHRFDLGVEKEIDFLYLMCPQTLPVNSVYKIQLVYMGESDWQYGSQLHINIIPNRQFVLILPERIVARDIQVRTVQVTGSTSGDYYLSHIGVGKFTDINTHSALMYDIDMNLYAILDSGNINQNSLGHSLILNVPGINL